MIRILVWSVVASIASGITVVVLRNSVGIVEALLATTLVGVALMYPGTWGDSSGAWLVYVGVFPESYAQNRFATAVSLLALRAARSGSTTAPLRLELEGCSATDREISTLVHAICSACQSSLRLETSPRLQMLALRRCTTLSATDLGRVVNARANHGATFMEVLDLIGCVSLGDSAAELLGALLTTEAQDLQELSLAACGLSAAGVSAISAAASGVFDAANTFASGPAPMPATDKLPAPLAGLGTEPLVPPINEPPPLHVPWSPFLQAALTFSPSAPVRQPKLRALELSSNALAGAGRALASLARNLPTLQVLKLEDASLATDDIERLSRALPHSRLLRVDLAGNFLRAAGLLAVAGGIRMSHVQDLGLERNDLCLGKALEALRESQDRKPLSRLRLSGNLLTVSQEVAFMESLRKPTATNGRLSAAFSGCPPGCTCFEGRGEVM